MEQRGNGAAAFLPDVDGDRCVLSAVAAASCRACVEACPRGAFVLSDEALGLDTAACDGCAICAAACPQGAIGIDRPPVAISPNENSIALAACERAAPPSGKGVMPCLHAIGTDELADLYSGGTRQLILTHGDCETCKPGLRTGLEEAVAQLQRLTEDRGLYPIEVVRLPQGEWARLRNEVMAPSRRSLFKALRPGRQPRTNTQARRRQAALALSAGGVPAPLNPFLPAIDLSSCSGCDACARICPEGAIRLELDGSEAAYVVEPARCSGCRLCIDVCDVAAVSISRWRPAGNTRLRLDTAQCPSCGNMYRQPGGQRTEHGLCRICATTGPNRNLFQVIR